MEILEQLQKGAELYKGFIIPKADALQLRVNNFQYEADEECFIGTIETEEGELRNYEYYPSNFFWNLLVTEDNY